MIVRDWRWIGHHLRQAVLVGEEIPYYLKVKGEKGKEIEENLIKFRVLIFYMYMYGYI